MTIALGSNPIPLLNANNRSVENYVGRTSDNDTEEILVSDLTPEELVEANKDAVEPDVTLRPKFETPVEYQIYSNLVGCKGYAKGVVEYCAIACGGF